MKFSLLLFLFLPITLSAQDTIKFEQRPAKDSESEWLESALILKEGTLIIKHRQDTFPNGLVFDYVPIRSFYAGERELMATDSIAIERPLLRFCKYKARLVGMVDSPSIIVDSNHPSCPLHGSRMPVRPAQYAD